MVCFSSLSLRLVFIIHNHNKYSTRLVLLVYNSYQPCSSLYSSDCTFFLSPSYSSSYFSTCYFFYSNPTWDYFYSANFLEPKIIEEKTIVTSYFYGHMNINHTEEKKKPRFSSSNFKIERKAFIYIHRKKSWGTKKKCMLLIV